MKLKETVDQFALVFVFEPTAPSGVMTELVINVVRPNRKKPFEVNEQLQWTLTERVKLRRNQER